MQSDIRIKNTARDCTIDIEGVIGVPEAAQFGDPEERVATYEKFRAAVARIAAVEAPEIVVNIRSTGGDVNDALLIYDALRTLRGHVTTRCYGYTASAATLIAQAAAEGARELSANALYLIHRSTAAAEGNACQVARDLELLRKTDERLAGIYAARSGRPAAEYEALMAENDGNGRWLSPAEAIAAGLADRIADAPTGRAAALTGRIVRNWERLLRRAGVRTPPVPPILPVAPIASHAPDAHATSVGPIRSAAGATLPGAKGRLAEQPPVGEAGPTRTKPCEDPSITESIPSPNERAYAEDARRLAKNN